MPDCCPRATEGRVEGRERNEEKESAGATRLERRLKTVGKKRK